MTMRTLRFGMLGFVLLATAIACRAQSTITGTGSIGGSVSLVVVPPNGGGTGAATWLPGFGQAGWFKFSSNTALTSVCPPNNFNGTTYAWTNNCPNIVNAWGGAAYDQNGHCLMVFGGGHVDYPGNEVYALCMGTSATDPNRATIRRLNDPTTANQAGGGSPANNGGSQGYGWLLDARGNGKWPNAIHSYFNLVVDDNQNFYFAGGSPQNINGNTSTSMGFFNIPSLAWTRIDNGSTPGSGNVPGDCGSCLGTYEVDNLVYNSNNGHIIILTGGNIASCCVFDYDPVANTSHQVINAMPATGLYPGAVYDSKDNKLYEYGNGDWNVTTPGAPTGTWPNWAAVGGCNSTCTAAIGGQPVGAAYDPAFDVIYFFTGSGSTVYKYTPVGNTWTAITTNTNPCSAGTGSNGIFGRWQFDSAYQVAVYLGDATSQACIWWPSAQSSPNTFANRTAGINIPGGSSSVVSSQGFESALPNCGPSFPCTSWTTGGNSQASVFHFSASTPSQDCTLAADGLCSLKFTITNGSFQGDAGLYDYNFSPNYATGVGQFGAGQEFYVQYKTRIDSALYGGGAFTNYGGTKHDITTEGDTSTVQAPDCSNSPGEFVTQTDSARFNEELPYVNCGFAQTGAPFFMNSGYEPIQMGGIAGSDFLDEDAAGCPHFGTIVAITDPTCFLSVGGEWWTIQKHVKVGTFGTASSVMEVWMAHSTKTSVLITNAADAAIPNDGTGGASGKYGKIELSSYSTGATYNVNSQINFDDIIVSKRRIPDPDVATPNAPDSLTLAVSTGHIVVSWRVNSQNNSPQDDTGFLVERCTGTPQTCMPNSQSGFSQIAKTAPGAPSYQDNTTVASTTYTYRVRAKNAIGNSAYTVAICFNGGTTCGGTATAQ